MFIHITNCTFSIYMSISILSSIKCFEGELKRFRHSSAVTKVNMICTVYIPSISIQGNKLPCILYLSGLTCTDENVCQKSGVFRKLSDMKVGFIAPDTSPRGAGIPGETDNWDFGVGAGFYLDASQHPWSENYNMYSYITVELLDVITVNFPQLDLSNLGITGHSMGGHGALTIALKNPQLFRSVSAFAPIVNPMQAPWGIKAFSNYLGSDQNEWRKYDACNLLEDNGVSKYDDILIDIGTADPFLTSKQLLPENFIAICESTGQKVTVRMQEGYDHSYYFISTFIEDHINFHVNRFVGLVSTASELVIK